MTELTEEMTDGPEHAGADDSPTTRARSPRKAGPSKEPAAFERRWVMRIRASRRWLRLLSSSLAVFATVVLLFLGFAAWTRYLPPAALVPDTTATARPAVPRAEPVLETNIFDAGALVVVIIIAFLGIILASAVLRWLVTDSRLEAARQRVGDVTVVSDKSFIEQARIQHDQGFETASERNAFLERRTESLAGEARTVLGRLSPSSSTTGAPASVDPTPVEPRVLHETLRALVAPDTVFTRITERCQLGNERAEVSLARTVEGSGRLKDLVLVPVLRIRRGSLLGALTLTVDGTASRTLPTVTSRGVLVLMLRAVAALVSAHIEDQQTMRSLLDLTTHVSSKIVSDVPLSEADRLKLLDRYDVVVGAGRKEEVIEWMRSLIDLALATDVIFAPIAGGCGTTRRLVTTFEEPYRSHVRGGEAHVRRFTGIGREVVNLDLLRVAESNSFHLDVTADESSYIEQADVILSRAHGDALAGPPELEDSEYLLVSPLRGDHRVHLYWRDFKVRTDQKQPSHVAPRLEVRLRERPPGLLGPTLALSLWMWVITWVVGYFYPVLFADVEATSSAWSTLILAAPALLTGLLLSRLTSDAVRVMSVSTFALVIWLSVNVATVVSVAALTLSGVQFGDADAGILSLHQPAWSIVMFLTGVHLLSCVLLFVGRGRRYIRTINERWQQ